MRKAKRFLALAVALASTLSFAACGDNSSGGGAVTTKPGVELDSEQVDIINDATADVDWGNTDLDITEVRWLSHYDINPTDGKTEDIGIRLFKDKYNGTIKWDQTTWDERYTKLASLVAANDSPDIFPADDMDAFPIGAIAGMFQPIDDYVDFKNQFWADSLEYCDTFSIGANHYVAVIQPTPNLVCVYNKDTMDQNGYDQPADLYYDGEWTWAAMQEMAIDFTDADSDHYAFDGWFYWNAISQTKGVPMIGMEDGVIKNNLEDPDLSKAQDFIYELSKAGVGFPRHLNDWNCRDTDAGQSGIGQGLTLFMPIGMWDIENTLENTAKYGDVEAGEVMFVPMPSEDGSEPFMPARVNGFLLVSGAKNPEGFGAFMLCKKVAATLPETQAVGDAVLTDAYGWTEEMMEMRTECYRLAKEKPVFEFYEAVTQELKDAFGQIATSTSVTNGNATSWASVVSEQNNGVNYYVDKANKAAEEAISKQQ